MKRVNGMVAPRGEGLRVLAWTGSPVPVFWVYLVLITVAELATSLVDLQTGMLCHLALVFISIAYGTFGRTEAERQLALALTLAPFIRLLSLSLPLVRLPQIAWYPTVAVPLLICAAYIVHQTGLGHRELALNWGHARWQFLLIPGGLSLGALEYSILRPHPMLTSYDAGSVALGAASLLLFTGFNEEFIFRGLLQRTATPLLGALTPLYIATLFGVLHIGYLSFLDVAFVTGVGLVFSYIVRWDGSLLGVTLMHGLTNVSLFILMPYVTLHEDPMVRTALSWAILASFVLFSVAVVALWRVGNAAGRDEVDTSREQATAQRLFDAGVQVAGSPNSRQQAAEALIAGSPIQITPGSRKPANPSRKEVR